MPNTLAAQAVAQFRDNGYYFPHPVLDADEVADLRARTEAAEAADGEQNVSLKPDDFLTNAQCTITSASARKAQLS